MRYLFVFINLCIVTLAGAAQELRPVSFEASGDVMHGKMLRQDFNGNTAAIVKVKLPVQGVTFDGNLIGEPEFHTNEYWVWLEAGDDGTRMFDVACPGTETVRVVFADISPVEQLQSKTIYELRFDIPARLLSPGMDDGVTAELMKEAKKLLDQRKYAEVLAIYLPLAKRGNAAAQYYAGMALSSGNATPQQKAEGLQWLEKAADQDYYDALRWLPTAYRLGLNCPANPAKADEWKRKALAAYRRGAERGNADAQCCLGQAYLEGDGVPMDKQEARRLLRLSADQGWPLSCYWMGNMDESTDPKSALGWYRKAVAGDDCDVYNSALGLLLLTNPAVRNTAEAMRYLERAAELDKYGNFCFGVGSIYEIGDGIPADKQKAIKWYTLGASRGDASCKDRLAALR
ncbi:MAG: sel1 repeat family protein [Muribaculaceae bacterium]|nr:sel1 repeat family protein [Muribaculaceae bacterium]